MKLSAFSQQSNVEFHGFFNIFQSDSLVVAVNGGPFLCGHGHGAEAVNMGTDGAVMPGVGALYH